MVWIDRDYTGVIKFSANTINTTLHITANNMSQSKQNPDWSNIWTSQLKWELVHWKEQETEMSSSQFNDVSSPLQNWSIQISVQVKTRDVSLIHFWTTLLFVVGACFSCMQPDKFMQCERIVHTDLYRVHVRLHTDVALIKFNVLFVKDELSEVI